MLLRSILNDGKRALINSPLELMYIDIIQFMKKKKMFVVHYNEFDSVLY